MTINHNDVYDFLHHLRKQTGVDLISQPKMVNIHGRTYPTIGNNLIMDKSDGWGELNIYIPHENGYVTHLNHVKSQGPNSDKPPSFNTALLNDMVPGTLTTASGLVRPTFHVAPSRIGPFNMDNSGNIQRTGVGDHKPIDETHVHGYLEHISGLPSPEGHARNPYKREGNGPIPRDKMHAVDLAEGLGHRREFDVSMTMPKGTEHHIGIAEIAEADGPRNRYLYDVGSESLTVVPKEMHAKWKDVG